MDGLLRETGTPYACTKRDGFQSSHEARPSSMYTGKRRESPMMRTITASRGVALLAVLVAAAGCESKATKDKLAQLTTVSAEKDSLLSMMAENTKLMSEISTELAKVKEVRRPMGAVKNPESP